MSGTAQAFIAFLHCEATQAEERAKSLRATAAAIEANNLKRKRRRDDGSATKEHNAYSMFLKGKILFLSSFLVLLLHYAAILLTPFLNRKFRGIQKESSTCGCTRDS